MLYRNEHKYICSQAEIEILRLRLPAVMKSDPHVGTDGRYQIRSLYFDDLDNSCYMENEAGADNRRKWQIRIYNGSDAVIHLECKYKDRGMTRKDSISLSREEADLLIDGTATVDPNMPALWNEFVLLIQTKGYHPVTIVQYERYPFVEAVGNVRITLDLDIGSATCFDRFFEKDIPIRPVMPLGTQLLEVKYDELLPDYIRHALALSNKSVTNFSKYYLCRRLPLSAPMNL